MSESLHVRQQIPIVVIVVAMLLAMGLPAQAADVTEVPLWDGEVEDPSGRMLNRFGGNTVAGNVATVSHTTTVVRSGTGAFHIETNQPIPPSGYDFVATALTGFGPSSAYVDIRDITPFEAVRFWFRNDTGAAFTLFFEIKDYRDSNDHRCRREIPIAATSGWTEIEVPFDLASGWVVIGSPELSRTKLFGLVIEATEGVAVDGSLYLDDMVLIEPGGPINSSTAPIDILVAHLARRQFNGMWGARSHSTGMLPSVSSYADICATNVLAALIKLLPGAVSRGWLTRQQADDYMLVVASALNSIMDSVTYLPPRYFDRVTLNPVSPYEESSVDAAFLFLALYQYKSDPGCAVALEVAIDTLLNRFNFAAFSSTVPAGWDMAYNTSSGLFSGNVYDGYSGEPWLISLAAHLATVNHVDITTHYNSAVNRTRAFLIDESLSHVVHSSPEFRAPFLQWLFSLFVDVTDRGIDSYPDITLATNPYANAVRYQVEVHACLDFLNRPLLLQPDAGDDGTGAFYRQFSCYNDFGLPELFMPWSSSFGFLAEPAAAEAALRHIFEHRLHGPLGPSDAAKWNTGDPGPFLITGRHDFWNIALSTMAFALYLYPEDDLFSDLSEVQEALSAVFPIHRDGFESGDTSAWSAAFPLMGTARMYGAKHIFSASQLHPGNADINPAATFISSNNSAGMGWCRRQVMDTGRSPLWVTEPTDFTSFLLRPAMHGTQRCLLASGCSTYLGVRLRAPRVAATTGHRASPTSRRNPMRSVDLVAGPRKVWGRAEQFSIMNSEL